MTGDLFHPQKALSSNCRVPFRYQPKEWFTIHWCSCEPERAAAIQFRLEQQKAAFLKACLEVQQLELEIKRRELLLASGELGPFAPVPICIE